MTDHTAHELAERFWRRCGQREDIFARSLERAILWTLPVLIVKLPRLGVVAVREWLVRRGIQTALPAPERPLMGFIFARGGVGVLFIDGAEPDDEQRYSLAHELSHFLLEYLWPREAAIAAMGEGIREVLDGVRPPTQAERFSALLRNVTLGTYTHLMDRDRGGRIGRADTLACEDDADRLALELLAPYRLVARKVKRGTSPLETVSAAAVVLVEEFGLPAQIAARYGRHIVGGLQGRQTFRDWLGIGSAGRGEKNS